MREKEKNPSERNQVRNQEFQWQKVIKRRSATKKPPQATRTCFVNHLPLHLTSHEIANIFRTHGPIEFIYIPMIRNNKLFKCAFVQFRYPQSLPTAVRDENRRKIEANRITVHPAKYDKSPSLINNTTKNDLPLPPPTTRSKPLKTTNSQYTNAMRDSRSFKDVALHQKPPTDNPQPNQNKPSVDPCKPIQHPFPFDIPPTTANKTSIPKPSYHRIMNSRALGEDTENARNSLREIDLEDDFVAAFEGKVCSENQEMLERSAIGFASSSQSSEIILDHILAEGVNCLTIKAMGGMLHLLIFDTFEDKKLMMESKWLERWFTTIRNVNDHSATMWRETWLKVYGVPLIAWSYENFYKIGCIFGRVISVNYKEYDCAHILIFTDSLFELNGKMSMIIGENSHSIFVSEARLYKSLPQQYGPPLQESNLQKSKPTEPIPVPENPKSPSPKDDHSPSKSTEQPPKIHTTPGKRCNTLINDDVPSQRIPHQLSPPITLSNKEFPCQITPHDSPSHVTSNQNPKVPDTPHSFKSNQKSLNFSPIQPNKEKNLTLSPAQSRLNTATDPVSPVKIHNKFGPLLRSSSKQPSSYGTNGSSSCSGPLFPPGFEDSIPTQIKTAQEEKRRKRQEKKKKLKSFPASLIKVDRQSPLTKGPDSITAEDIMDWARILGLTFKGPQTELKKRIEKILLGQKHDWESHQR